MKKILLICIAICFVFALSALAFDDMGKSTTVNGWISDDMCGAKGANAGAAACTKKCLDKGAKVVVVTDGDQKVLAVDNPDALKGHEGHHVAVTGSVKGDSIHVDSVKML
jgi:sugar/nucleoside kinase (ribokinase family)